MYVSDHYVSFSMMFDNILRGFYWPFELVRKQSIFTDYDFCLTTSVFVLFLYHRLLDIKEFFSFLFDINDNILLKIL